MKVISLLVLTIVAGGMVPNVFSAGENASTLYMLLDDHKNQWCGYHDEKRWRSAIDEIGSMDTASVDFANEHPKTVKITHADEPEAGDWIVYDRYDLDEHGVVRSLERTANVLSGDVSKKEVFEFRDGRFLPKSVVARSLQSGKLIAVPNVWFPKLPKATGITDLPFGALIVRSQEVRTQDSVCVPGGTGSAR